MKLGPFDSIFLHKTKSYLKLCLGLLDGYELIHLLGLNILKHPEHHPTTELDPEQGFGDILGLEEDRPGTQMQLSFNPIYFRDKDTPNGWPRSGG